MKTSFRLPLSAYPGMNPFVLDWLSGREEATRLLPRGEAPAAPVSGRGVDAALAEALIASNAAWGIDATAAVGRWRSGEALTIVAGQQVGFAGGPLYTLSKLATLVRMKRDLEKQGIPATAFFWLATEDHDFDEVANLKVAAAALSKEKAAGNRNDLLCLRAVRKGDARGVVGALPVPEALIAGLLPLLGLERPRWLREGISFRDSFAELIAAVLGDEVVLVDSLLPELRRAGAPLFEQIRSRGREVQDALRRRAGELGSAGYREQVVPGDGDDYTLLFRLDDEGRRMPVRDAEPLPAERTSTSAITRPLLQDFALQPDVFVGGPAEVAYYAQIAALHPLLGVRMPRVALRGHALVATSRAMRTIERYSIDPSRLFSPADELLAEKEPEGVARINAIAEAAKIDLMGQIERISEIALPADRSLVNSFRRTAGHLEYHFSRLGERAVRALVRKERERWQATSELISTIYPDRKVQERVASWLPWWCRHGSHLVERLVEEIEPDANAFTIVGV